MLKKLYQNWAFTIKSIFGVTIGDVNLLNYEPTLQILTRRNTALLNFLQKNSSTQLKTLIDIVVYDEPTKQYRFTIIYLLLSTNFNYRAQVYFKTSHLHPVLSVTNLFKAAIWAEREIWDLYGFSLLGTRI